MDKKEIVKMTYDEIAEKYSEIYFDKDVNIFRNILNEFLEFLPKKAIILDAGCGTDNFTKYFLGRHYEVISIDISDGMLDIAKRNVPDGDFRKMDLFSTDFKDNFFDAIFLKSVLVNVEKKDVPKILSELKRILKPDGMILISIYIGKGEHLVDEPLNSKLKMLFNFYSRNEAENVIKSSGFRITRTLEFEHPEKLSKYYEGKFLVFFIKK